MLVWLILCAGELSAICKKGPTGQHCAQWREVGRPGQHTSTGGEMNVLNEKKKKKLFSVLNKY
jgi:hypothetical protein